LKLEIVPTIKFAFLDLALKMLGTPELNLSPFLQTNLDGENLVWGFCVPTEAG